MPFNPFDFITPKTLEVAAKGLNAIGVPCKGAAELLEEITKSEAYAKHRIDNAMDKVQDTWDDYKEDVSNFIDNVGDTISDTWDTVTDAISDNIEDVLDGLGSIFLA